MEPDELRPVEALWLLDDAGRQRFDRENALRAVLVDLSVRGLLEPEEDGEGLAPSGQPPDDLREYEADVLVAIEGEDDERAMVDAVYDFDYRELFFDAGLFEEVEEEKSMLFGLINWTATEIVETDRYGSFLAHLGTEQTKLRAAVEEQAVRPDEMPMLYAFPDADFFGAFDDHAEELMIDLDETVEDGMDAAMMASTSAASSAAVIAASSAASCAAASSATAASACAAGGAAGAGAGAGGAI